MHRPVLVTHSSFIEGSHTTKNKASAESGRIPTLVHRIKGQGQGFYYYATRAKLCFLYCFTLFKIEST